MVFFLRLSFYPREASDDMLADWGNGEAIG